LKGILSINNKKLKIGFNSCITDHEGIRFYNNWR